MRLMDKRVGARKRRTPVRSRERVQPTINNERAESVAESVVFVCRFHAVIVLDLLSLSSSLSSFSTALRFHLHAFSSLLSSAPVRFRN